MIVIKTQSIRAACCIAETKDARRYLNGVQILVRDDGTVHVRASDGHVAFDDVMPELSAHGPANFIIPINVAKNIAKIKSRSVEITKLAADGYFLCAGHRFAPVDGKFPDLDRVIPSRIESYDTAVNHYDADLLARCQTAMRVATGNRNAFFRVQNSPAGLMFRENATWPRCIIMALNANTAFLNN